MCRKSPEQCKAKYKICESVINNNNVKFGGGFMLNFKILRDMKLGIPVGEMVVLVAGKGAHSAINFDNKIVLDSEQETGKLGLNEVDNQFEQQSFIIDIKGE